MRIGVEKKDENRYRDLSLPLRAARYHILQRSKAPSHCLPRNLNIWLCYTLSKNRSGSYDSSTKSATMWMIRTLSIAITKEPSPLRTILNITHEPNTSTFNIISSGIALKMEGLAWNTVQPKIWWQMDSQKVWDLKGIEGWAKRWE